jgi:hypothetical protein
LGLLYRFLFDLLFDLFFILHGLETEFFALVHSWNTLGNPLGGWGILQMVIKKKLI